MRLMNSIELTPHARAILCAFLDHEPVFEAWALRRVPVMDTPLSLNEGNVVVALFELEAQGLIRQWAPPVGADPVKPHPQLCLRRYWPPGRIWVRAGGAT